MQNREIAQNLTDAIAALTAIAAALGEPEAPAKPARTKAPAKAPAAPAPAKAYRSAKGKEQAKAECLALSVRYDLKVTGGTRTFKSLSAKEQAAYRAETKAIWAAVPKTRSTKA